MSLKRRETLEEVGIFLNCSLFVLPDVDCIITLKDSKICEMGTYEELMARKESFASLIEQFSETVDEQEEEISQKSEGREIFVKMRRQSSVKKRKPKLPETQENTKLVEEEKLETGTVKFSIYCTYLREFSFLWIAATVICYFMYQATNAGSNYWLSLWTNDADSNTDK